MSTDFRKTAVAALLGATVFAAGCGGDNESDTPTTAATVAPTATVAVTPTPTPGKKKGGKGKGKGKSEKTATPTPAATKTSAPNKGLPQTSPTPGPPLSFTATYTSDAVTPNLKSIPAGKPLRVLLVNKTSKKISIALISNGTPVATGQVVKKDKLSIDVRQLDPGKLEIQRYPVGAQKADLSTTVKVVAGG